MQTPKFHIAIKNAASDGLLELHFLDVVSNKSAFDWFTGELITTNLVEETITQVKAASPTKIKCIIDSIGGDAGIGLAIYNFLKSYNAKVEVEIIGMAGSIASVIAMAASKGKLFIARNAFMVIHKAWGIGIGNSDELRGAADVIDKYTAQVVDIYSQRTGKPTDVIAALITDGDYWMSGIEAVQQGFADSVFNDNAEVLVAAHLSHLPKQYKNVPTNIKDKLNNTSATIAIPQKEKSVPLIAEEDFSIDEPHKTPYSFFNNLKQEFMHIVNQIKEAFAGVKNQYEPNELLDNKTEASTAVFNVATLIDKLETALTPALENIANRIEAIEKDKVENKTLTSLQNELSKAATNIEQLQGDVANLLGGSAHPKVVDSNIQPIGRFRKN